MVSAFRDVDIETLNLNEGLKVIGNRAFEPKEWLNGLTSVEIPSTVKVIGSKAFSNNNRLIKNDSTWNTDRFKLRSEKTIVVDQLD